jgi:hypothetical protein
VVVGSRWLAVISKLILKCKVMCRMVSEECE